MYRLPKDVEWEYACRGGATSEAECSWFFYFDKPTNDLSSEQANFNGTQPSGKAPKGKSLGRPTRVGAYPSNKLGLCDMHGNVGQWCLDAIDEGKLRVCRGGNWLHDGDSCQAQRRGGDRPLAKWNSRGFRLARVPVRDAGAAPEQARALRFPALLRGQDKPFDNAERLIFAQIAFDQKHFACAARLLAEAMASDSKLADDPQAPHRCNAARAAAGQGATTDSRQSRPDHSPGRNGHARRRAGGNTRFRAPGPRKPRPRPAGTTRTNRKRNRVEVDAVLSQS